jgi:tetratricopeptide (TPR) repeat protein
VDQAKVALDLDSTYARARFWIGMAAEQLGRSDEAIRELKATIEKGGATSAYVAALGHVYATSGRRREALRILEDLETVEVGLCLLAGYRDGPTGSG